ncbi:phosphotransferase family enzyme [Herbihabitans rhizosphaerae]|uniref:Phosphotransferase family enzyme n=1 Tax=Herbihabitans rhizosphaerae TaxID=1872711 RepID=A0A4Q7KC18_9PSEU|nr:aminoglycoside phosphotransferase family protein [Herbihabitans rhizosphaerae]RZS29765.1 phosphotransferase family enzyme [Herbihabitans rhizosphaerae]
MISPDTPPVSERLRAELGQPSDVGKLYSSPGSHVWRVLLGETPAVVKQFLGDGADARFDRETTALHAAAAVEPPLVPELLGSEPDDHVVVLEHLETAKNPPSLVTFTDALARLHALGSTAKPDLPDAVHIRQSDVDAFVGLCTKLWITVPDDAAAELAALVERLAAAPRTALLHGDPCYGNVLSVGGRAYFVDFEQASLGDGAAELSYLRAGFPTCGLCPTLSDVEIRQAEAVYRDGWRGAGGSGEPGSVIDHCVAWALRGDALVQRSERGRRDQLARLVTENWSWGPHTARERLTRRLGVVASLAGGTATGRLAATVRQKVSAL